MSLKSKIKSPSQPIVAYLQMETDAPCGTFVNGNDPGDGVELARERIKIGMSFNFSPLGRTPGTPIGEKPADGTHSERDEKRSHPED